MASESALPAASGKLLKLMASRHGWTASVCACSAGNWPSSTWATHSLAAR
jgi:hypothetical protein